MARPKNYTIKELIKRLRNEGIVTATTHQGARQTVQNWIRRGILELRQSPHNRYYLVTEKEIEEIVHEFSPGGEGCWITKK